MPAATDITFAPIAQQVARRVALRRWLGWLGRTLWIAVGGVADHVHIVVSMRPNISISDLVRDIKASSSKWINEKQFVEGKFQWQSGFGAFSYAQSQLNNVIAYVNNQESHHQKQTFKEEYIDLLEKFEIDYEHQYLFDSIEQ